VEHPAAPGARQIPSSAAIWAGIWVLYIVWGSTYLAIAIAVETIPPFLMVSARFLLAGFILVTWSVARAGRAFRIPTCRQVRDSAIVGALLMGGGVGLVAVGEQSVPSGVTALLIAMLPLWVAVFGRVALGDRLPRVVYAAIVLGLVGVAVLAWPGDASLADVEPVQLAAVILSPMCWAIGSLFAARRARLPDQPLLASGLQMILGGLALAVMSVAAGELVGFDPGSVSSESFGSLLYLTLFGSVVAFTVYAWLIQVAPLARVTTYAYVNPVVAVVLGAMILGEPLTARAVVAGAIIVLAVAVIVTARGRLPVRGQAASDGPRVGAGVFPEAVAGSAAVSAEVERGRDQGAGHDDQRVGRDEETPGDHV
jgi:drug/metabolite transporter (DMT)-like permease